MRRFNLVVLLAFACGCSGEGFTTAGLAALDAADSAPGTGGVAATGGASGTGGASTGGKVSTGGAPEADAGDSAPPSSGGQPGTGGSPQTGGAPTTGGAPATGGAPNTGGAQSTGGAAVDACALVTHDNGLGAMWEDCVPLGTYSLEQAMKACKASGAASCTKSMGCGGDNETVYGLTLGSLFAHWGYGSVNAGYVNDTSVCPHDGDPRWN